MFAYSTAQYIGFGILAVIAVAMFVIIGMLTYYKARFMHRHGYLFQNHQRIPDPKGARMNLYYRFCLALLALGVVVLMVGLYRADWRFTGHLVGAGGGLIASAIIFLIRIPQRFENILNR